MRTLRFGTIDLLENKDEYFDFKDKEEADRWGMSGYKEWGNKLKQKEIIKRESGMFKDSSWAYCPLELYLGWRYQEINRYLRYGDTENIFESDKYCAVRIAEELLDAPRINKNIVVYRYVNEEFINELIKTNKKTSHKYYLEKGYLSTSLLKDIMKDAPDGSFLLKIYVDKGTVGIYANAVAPRDEYEILIRNNSFIRMCNKPYMDPDYNIPLYECKLYTTNIY